MKQVMVYGADWCPDTHATLNNLDSLGVPYQFIDIDDNSEGRQWVKDHNDGRRKTPMLDIEGNILAAPDERQLEEALRGRGLMS
jgi:thioredoxin reductase (NADPH)